MVSGALKAKEEVAETKEISLRNAQPVRASRGTLSAASARMDQPVTTPTSMANTQKPTVGAARTTTCEKGVQCRGIGHQARHHMLCYTPTAETEVKQAGPKFTPSVPGKGGGKKGQEGKEGPATL